MLSIRVRRLLLLPATLGAASLVMASTTCVTATIPSVGTDLAATQTELQWIADAYPVVLGALLLPAGALLDLYGRRRGLLLGLVLLGVALLWSGLVTTPGALIASRAVAGIGGALVFPATLATITAGFEAERRSLAIGLWAASVMAGGGYGLVLGGAMVEVFDWSAAFLVIASITALCFALGAVSVPETKDPEHAHLDPLGSVLSMIAIGGLTVGIIEWPVRGFTDLFVAGALAVGAVGAAAFVYWELRTPRPLLEVRLFGDRMFASATAAIFVMFGAAFGWFFLSFQYYAYVLDWGPLKASLGLMPNIVPLVAFAPVGAVVARRTSVRTTMLLALGIMTTGAALTAYAGHTRDFGWIALGFAFIGLGGGLGSGPATQGIVEALPRAKQGVASAVNDAARELGAAVGIAAIGSAFTAGYRRHLDGLEVAAAVRDSPAAGLASVGSAPGQAHTVDIVRDATVAGWEFGLLAAAALLAAGFALVLVRAPRGEWRATSPDSSTRLEPVGTAGQPGTPSFEN
jgi:MFS family permease